MLLVAAARRAWCRCSASAAATALLLGMSGCNLDGALPVVADRKVDAQAPLPDGSSATFDLGPAPLPFQLGEPLYQGGVSLYTAGQAADVNGDTIVDGIDLSIVLLNWGEFGDPEEGGGNRSADLNGDGVVDGGDIGLLLLSWNQCGSS